jgi:hypothetical protein
VSPLRKFGPGALAGSVIRAPGSGVRPILKNIPKPATSVNLSEPDPTPGMQPVRRPGPASQNGTHH